MEGGPPSKRPHLDEKHDLGARRLAAVCNEMDTEAASGTTMPEPLEDYTKVGALPPPTKPVKVSTSVKHCL